MLLPLVVLAVGVKAEIAADSISFLAIGDWGGASDEQPTTSAQVANGHGMAKQAANLGARFVMAMGDNFYSSGVHGDAHSPRFKETFEDAFPEPELQVPWYVIAGNHDHKGNVSAQIAYTKDSTRWRYPDYWYDFTTTEGDLSVQIVYIDTVTLSGMSFHDEEADVFVKGEPHPMQAMASKQLAYIESTLKSSTADYLFVSGHYPIYSQCTHGPTAELILQVLPLMRKYKASGFLAGHDHCLGHYDGLGDDEGMVFVVAGAGKECCYAPSHLNTALNKGNLTFRMDKDESHGAAGGFASVTATASGATVTYYNTEGTALYTSKAVAPRSKLVEAEVS